MFTSNPDPKKSGEKAMLDLVEVHANYRRVFNEYFPGIKIHKEEMCGHFWITRHAYNFVFGTE